MGTPANDYDPWRAAAMLYQVADATDRVARIRATVAASLREVGQRAYPDRRAEALEQAAARARHYARTLRERARKLTGWQPWRG
jgi:hypothetical protein